MFGLHRGYVAIHEFGYFDWSSTTGGGVRPNPGLRFPRTIISWLRSTGAKAPRRSPREAPPERRIAARRLGQLLQDRSETRKRPRTHGDWWSCSLLFGASSLVPAHIIWPVERPHPERFAPLSQLATGPAKVSVSDAGPAKTERPPDVKIQQRSESYQLCSRNATDFSPFSLQIVSLNSGRYR